MKASALRRGSVVVYNKTPYRVIDFNHSTPGNLRARVQTKLRNLLNGTQTEVRFGATEDVEEADIYYFKATYLYSDSEGFHFMNSENYEQMALSTEILADSIYYLQENMEVQITTYEGQAIGIELPSTVILTVVDTEPELKGSTASNSPKPAKLDTGLTISVPAFVKIGEKIVVNTGEGTYVSRAN